MRWALLVYMIVASVGAVVRAAKDEDKSTSNLMAHLVVIAWAVVASAWLAGWSGLF